MTWRIVHIKDSEKMFLRLDNLVVKKLGQDYIIPLSDISMVITEGGSTVVTLRLLSAFSKYNIVLVVCDKNHLPTGVYHGENQYFRAYKKLQQQLSWTQAEKDKLWQIIVYHKIDNQQDVLSYLEQDFKAIGLLSDYKESVTAGDKTNREGHAAKVYFNALFGQGFSRVTKEEADIINAGLNYGYTIFRAQMTRLIAGYGLNALLGVFHKNEYNHFNLADDFMEPFRPIIDLWVFLHLRDKDYLKYSYRLALIDLLNSKIKYGKETCTVTSAMDKYVKGLVAYMEKRDGSHLHCPIVSSVEWEKR